MTLTYSEFLKDESAWGINMYCKSPDYKGPRRFDQKLKKYLNYPGGFFVEAGANDGIRQSNTKIFEDLFGWRGLLVEPSPLAYQKCVENRPKAIVEHCALVSSDYPMKTASGDFDGDLMSSLNGRRLERQSTETVPAATLTSILEKHKIKNVDFLSLDLEGYELDVLQGFDFSKFKPKHLLIEVHRDERDEIYQLLLSHGYQCVENFYTGEANFSPPPERFRQCDYLFELL